MARGHHRGEPCEDHAQGTQQGAGRHNPGGHSSSGCGLDFLGRCVFGHKKVLLSKMEEVPGNMRFVRLSCPRGRRFTSVFGPNGRGGSRPAAVGHPAQAVAESSSRGHSPFARWQPPIRTVLNAKFPTPCDAGQILLYQVLPKMQEEILLFHPSFATLRGNHGSTSLLPHVMLLRNYQFLQNLYLQRLLFRVK